MAWQPHYMTPPDQRYPAVGGGLNPLSIFALSLSQSLVPIMEYKWKQQMQDDAAMKRMEMEQKFELEKLKNKPPKELSLQDQFWTDNPDLFRKKMERDALGEQKPDPTEQFLKWQKIAGGVDGSVSSPEDIANMEALADTGGLGAGAARTIFAPAMQQAVGARRSLWGGENALTKERAIVEAANTGSFPRDAVTMEVSDRGDVSQKPLDYTQEQGKLNTEMQALVDPNPSSHPGVSFAAPGLVRYGEARAAAGMGPGTTRGSWMKGRNKDVAQGMAKAREFESKQNEEAANLERDIQKRMQRLGETREQAVLALDTPGPKQARQAKDKAVPSGRTSKGTKIVLRTWGGTGKVDIKPNIFNKSQLEVRTPPTPDAVNELIKPGGILDQQKAQYVGEGYTEEEADKAIAAIVEALRADHGIKFPGE